MQAADYYTVTSEAGNVVQPVTDPYNIDRAAAPVGTTWEIEMHGRGTWLANRHMTFGATLDPGPPFTFTSSAFAPGPTFPAGGDYGVRWTIHLWKVPAGHLLIWTTGLVFDRAWSASRCPLGSTPAGLWTPDTFQVRAAVQLDAPGVSPPATFQSTAWAASRMTRVDGPQP